MRAASASGVSMKRAGVEPRQRPDAIPAVFRPQRLQEGELHVGPGAHLLAHHLEVALVVHVVDDPAAVLVHGAQHAVVEVERAVRLAHQRQVVGVEGAERESARRGAPW